MTVWNIHFLNARHGLTRVLPEIRAAAREAVARVGDLVDLPRFDLIVRAGPEVIPEWGMGGRAPAPGLIEVVLSPDRFQPDLLLRTLVHEMHHLIRWDGPGYGRSLGEALISEGLAGHFVVQVLGGKPDPWDSTTPASAGIKRALNEWSRLDYDHSEWFFGKGGMRKWTGYGLGYRLVSEYLTHAPDQDALTLVNARADNFRQAMRALAKADGAAGQSDEDEVSADQPLATDNGKAEASTND